VVRQSIKIRAQAPGKTRRLFADDPEIQGWRYGAMVTSLELPALQIWRLYRGRADCENRIKELKADFGLGSFNMAQFWATEAALGMAMLAYSTPVSATEFVSSGGDEIKRPPHAGNAAS
jgi:Transposase DDE domain